MSDSRHGQRVERGQQLSLGPFKFKVPDRECQTVSCEQKADGIVELNDSKINLCVECAIDPLELDGSEWKPLAGGRELGAKK